MAEHPNGRLTGIGSVLILAGMTGLLAGGSLFGGSDRKAAQSPVWRPFLRTRDAAVLQLGRDSIGSAYVTEERLLPCVPNYDAKCITASAEAINRFASAAGMPVYLLAVPTSAGIYADLMPEYAPLVNEHEQLRNLSAQINENVTWIEAESWLSTEREQDIYFRTDPCWTSYGAFCVYRTAIRKLGFSPLGYDHFIVSHFSSEYYGRLVQENGYSEIAPDMIDLYRYDAEEPLKSVTALRKDGSEPLSGYFRQALAAESGCPEKVFGTNAEAVLKIETENQNQRSLLLLTDSFGAAMTPLLLQHYRTVTAVNLELADAQNIDWRTLVNDGTTQYTQGLVLCGADLLRSPQFARAMQQTDGKLPEKPESETGKGDSNEQKETARQAAAAET